MRGINLNEVSIRNILNLFGAFGLLIRVVSKLDQQCAWVEYKGTEQAGVALSALNGASLFGRTMSISFSRFNCLHLCRLKGKVRGALQWISLTKRRTRQKYGLREGGFCTSLSPRLLASGVSRWASAEDLGELVAQAWRPTSVQAIGNGSFELMLESTEAGACVMAVLNGTVLNGERLQLRFADSKN